MYAIIETGGKQLKVEAGDAIFVEKLEVEAGEKVTAGDTNEISTSSVYAFQI